MYEHSQYVVNMLLHPLHTMQNLYITQTSVNAYITYVGGLYYVQTCTKPKYIILFDPSRIESQLTLPKPIGWSNNPNRN